MDKSSQEEKERLKSARKRETPEQREERLKKEKEEKLKERYSRVFSISNEEKNRLLFPSNEVNSTQFNNILMLYKPFLNQLRRVPIIYFVFMTFLEIFTSISPYPSIPTYVVILFVICLSTIREAFEDVGRYKTDLKINTAGVVKYKFGKWHRVNWRNIFVGDIIRLKESDTVPADCVCLASANDDRSFYLQTNSLNGRTTLTKRKSLEISNVLIGNGEVVRLTGEAEFNQVSNSFDEFDGMILLGEDYDVEFDARNFLPRGAMLRNTDWVVCLVGFTGKDTKIFMNSGEEPRRKVSKVERVIDIGVLVIVGGQLIVAVVVSILSGIWIKDNRVYEAFTGTLPADVLYGLSALLSFLILSNQMVPVSLVLCLEMVRMTLTYFVEKDELMYDTNASCYAEVLNSNVLEELGQVKYIVSDKTGTISSNKFQLKLLMMGKVLYGDPNGLSDTIGATRGVSQISEQSLDIEYSFEDARLKDLSDYGSVNDEVADLKLNERTTGRTIFHLKYQRDVIKEFLIMCAVCNGCEVSHHPDTLETVYHGMYSDEVAIVQAAKRLGVELLETGTFFRRVNVFGKEYYGEVLKVIRFNSKRRRSTVIVKHEGIIKLFCKGVPEVLYEILSQHQDIEPVTSNSTLHNAASQRGMRTICYAERIVSESEYIEFEKRVTRALRSVSVEEKERLISRLIIIFQLTR